MPRLRVNTPLWLGRDRPHAAASLSHARREARGRRRDRRRRHHRRGARLAVRRRRLARRARRGGRVGRGSTRGQHRAADAGAGHGPRRARAPLRRARARAGSGSSACAATAISSRTLTTAAHRLRPRAARLRLLRAAAARRRAAARRVSPAAGGRLRRPLAGRRRAAARRRVRRRRRPSERSGNAQADPFKACIGLMRAAARSRRADLRALAGRRRSGLRRATSLVRTPRGAIRADRVVIATGYATPYFKPLLARFRMLNTYVVATQRLAPRERRRIGLGAVMLWDTGRPYHYARWTPDHRLMLGGGDRPRRAGTPAPAALDEGTRGSHADFARLYPALADIDDRLPVGGPVRDDAGRPAVHRPASPLSAAAVRARLRRQRHDVRLPRRAAAARLVPRRPLSGSRAVRVLALMLRTQRFSGDVLFLFRAGAFVFRDRCARPRSCTR